MAYIYKIFCKDFNVKECYYGSTINFKQRKREHKSDCNKENSKKYNYPLYKFIRENNGWDNFKMQVIDSITSKEKKIYEKCERTYIEENRDIILNKDIPGRTKEEWIEDNKEKISEKKKIYRQNNKEKISKKGKIYYEKKKQKVSCEICNKILNKSSLLRHKKTNKKCLTLAQALNLHQ